MEEAAAEGDRECVCPHHKRTKGGLGCSKRARLLRGMNEHDRDDGGAWVWARHEQGHGA